MSRDARLPLASVICVHLALAFLIFDVADEDAFIYFRIADHIASGHGFVFNRDGPTLEASSSLLWQGLLAGFALLPVDLIVAAKLAGILFGALLLATLHRLTRLLVSDPWLATLPALLTVLSPPFAAWVQLGLETPLHAWLVLVAAWFCSEPRLARRAHLPLAALVASRPEGFLFLSALIPLFVVHRRRWKDLLPGVAVIAAVCLGLLVFRILYFHDLVPHPFYVKIDHGFPIGAGYIRALFVGMHLYLLAVPLLLVGWRRSFWSLPAMMMAFFLLVLLAWNYDLYDGKHYFRHFVPALPLFYVLCVAGLERLLGAIRPALWSACALSVALFLVQAQVPSRPGWVLPNPIHAALGGFLERPAAYTAAVARKLADPNATTLLDQDGGIGHNWWVRVGQFLQRNYPPGTTFAYDQMGQTPYYAGSDRAFVDLLGLTDRTVGHFLFALGTWDDPLLSRYEGAASWLLRRVDPGLRRPVSSADVLDYLFDSVEPDVVMLNRNLFRDPNYIGALMAADRRFAARYEHHYLLGEVIDVYGRKGAAPDEIALVPGLTVRRTAPGAAR